MIYETFKRAYFDDDAVAKAIGAQMETAFGSLVEQGIILEFSSTWWHMCDVAYNAHVKENYPD